MSDRDCDHRGADLEEALIAFTLLVALRHAVHLAVFRDTRAIAQIVALDTVTALIAAIAFVVGPHVDTHFAGVAFAFIAVGLPLAFCGFVIEKLASPHLSNLSALTGVLGIGVGLAAAGRAWRALTFAGAAALVWGTHGLLQAQLPAEAALIAAPACLAAVWVTARGLSRSAPGRAAE